LIIKILSGRFIVEFSRDLEKRVFAAARDNGINSVLFRNAVARKLGLNVTDSECLSLLSIMGLSTPTELAHYTGLTSGSTTAMLDRLERVRFIRRRPNPEDRRGVLVEIDTKWVETAAPLVMGVQGAHAELIASYSDQELETIADFLTRFTNNVIAHTRMIEEDIT
jgi:DNA-binding MarR family transcriptional regulator